jgi:hypothetical protein
MVATVIKFTFPDCVARSVVVGPGWKGAWMDHRGALDPAEIRKIFACHS